MVYLLITTFLAFYLKGITGFGNTLVMNAMFSFVKENRFTTPVDLLVGLPANLMISWKHRKELIPSVVLPLGVATLLGNIPGILILSQVKGEVLKVILGFVLIIMSLLMMFGMKNTFRRHQPTKVEIYSVGLFSGILVGMFGIGAFSAIYLSKLSKRREEFRSNLCFVFLMDNFFRLFAYTYQGLITQEVLRLSLWMIPVSYLGLRASRKTDQRLSELHIRYIVLILLSISGLLLVLKNL